MSDVAEQNAKILSLIQASARKPIHETHRLRDKTTKQTHLWVSAALNGESLGDGKKHVGRLKPTGDMREIVASYEVK